MSDEETPVPTEAEYAEGADEYGEYDDDGGTTTAALTWLAPEACAATTAAS